MTPRRKDFQSTDKSRKEDDEQSNDSSDMSNEDDGGSESESKIEGENGQESANASDEEEDDEGSSSDEDAEPNNEVDKEFKSPVHSDDDDVDSDFDKPEEEDESVSGEEEDGQPRRKKRKFNEPKRGMTADDILSKNKKWAMSRLAGNMVPANTVDDRTQAAMLKEAESTEKMNVESLKKYEEFELERKKRREKNSVRVFPPGPREQIKMTATGTTVTVSEIKGFRQIIDECSTGGKGSCILYVLEYPLVPLSWRHFSEVSFLSI
ncbi:Protein CBG03742 [Caenorhabditis briggsae]|uniref:Protein CBG03742 n=1 Tax=Caenorhabditis briggsae TaxID=6238 RepID=A8WWL9_CAEBR|nr:Protein CBG03742 [Caenorhabditis briggsae]CAP24586.2 Protein CBG03742 [Caenorhabditis briggsae]